MERQSNYTFVDYYQSIINKEETGFKLVLGGTGLGKTSSARKVIALPENKHKKFIYVANRIQLLNEFAHGLDELSNSTHCKIKYVHQKSDYEHLSSLTELEIRNLVESQLFKNYTNYLKKHQGIQTSKTYIKDYKFVKQQEKNFKTTDEGKEILREKTSKFFRGIKKILRTAFSVSKGSVSTPQFSVNDFDSFIENKTIQKLFPYISFLYDKGNETKQVLLITIQKAFYGVFDGKSTLNLQKLKNPNKANPFIILLDEFDFLESDLLQLITKDVNIDNPFDFVATFYRRLVKYKLNYEKFLQNAPAVKESIEKIINDITSLYDTYKINYPEINHFTCTDKELKGTAIFQTRNSISTKPIFLNQDVQRPNTFNLELNSEKANAYTLLNVVNLAVAQIIRIFKELGSSEDKAKQKLYQELLYHCFKTADSFQKTIQRTKQYPYKRIRTATDDSKLYHNGFGLFEIRDLQYQSDREEVELRYFSIFTTPEKILLQLCQKNLVFGLSATANFTRYLKNFDITWLHIELKNKYFNINKFDEKIIRNLNEKKRKKRDNQLSLHRVSEPLIHWPFAVSKL